MGDDCSDYTVQSELNKAVEDEVIEDEFNIHSTIGVVSALLLSCQASSIKDSKDLRKADAKECEDDWQSDCLAFELYVLATFLSMTCYSASVERTFLCGLLAL